jgi:hypothetical protein
VVLSKEERVTRATVRLALMSALQRCVAFEIRHIAVAPFGLGAGNLDIEDSADVMIGVLVEHMGRSAFPASVVIVAETDLEEEALLARIRKAK